MKPIQNSFHRQMDGLQIGLLIFFSIFVIVLGLFLFVGLLYRPICVTADHETGQVVTRTIIHGSKTILKSDIRGYSLTQLWTRFKDYPGIILYLNDNSKIELTEFNLEPLDTFKDFLKAQQIKYLGNEKSWFPFRPFKFRFDNET